MNIFDYYDFQTFARSWGLVFLFLIFLAAVTYALWPKNRDIFNHMASLPLNEGAEDETHSNPKSLGNTNQTKGSVR